MEDKQAKEDLEFDDDLPEDIHLHRISVPGGWIYLTYVSRKDGDETYSSDLSAVYVPGRR